MLAAGSAKPCAAEIVRHLVRQGAELETKSDCEVTRSHNSGGSALHMAVVTGNLATAKELLSLGDLFDACACTLGRALCVRLCSMYSFLSIYDTHLCVTC